MGREKWEWEGKTGKWVEGSGEREVGDRWQLSKGPEKKLGRKFHSHVPLCVFTYFIFRMINTKKFHS